MDPLHGESQMVELEKQRRRDLMAQRRDKDIDSGAFLRVCLPYLGMLNIVDRDRYTLLANLKDDQLENAVSTDELMNVAIAWNITSSSTDFWKIHKTRRDLLEAMFDFHAEKERLLAVKKYDSEQSRQRAVYESLLNGNNNNKQKNSSGTSEEMDEQQKLDEEAFAYEQRMTSLTDVTAYSSAVAPQQSSASVASTAAGSGSGTTREQAEVRRNSLVAVSQIFSQNDATLPYSGDQFGTRGDYVEGMIYASRRQAMDAEAKAKLEETKKQQSATVQAARHEARRRSSLLAFLHMQETDDGSGNVSGPFSEETEQRLLKILDEQNAAPEKEAAGKESVEGNSSTGTTTNTHSDHTHHPTASKMNDIHQEKGAAVGAIPAAAPTSSSSSAPLVNPEGKLHVRIAGADATSQANPTPFAASQKAAAVTTATTTATPGGRTLASPTAAGSKKPTDDVKPDFEKQRSLFYKNLTKLGENKISAQAAGIAQMAMRTMYSMSDANKQHRLAESDTLKKLRKELGLGAVNEKMMEVRNRHTYKAMSMMLYEERHNAKNATDVLDKNKTSKEHLLDLMSFVEEHVDEIPGATGGLIGEAFEAEGDDKYENDGFDDFPTTTTTTTHGAVQVDSSSPASTSRQKFVAALTRQPGFGPGAASHAVANGSLPHFSPVKLLKPSESAVAPRLTKPMLEKQLTKLDLYYKPVDSSNKEVLVIPSTISGSNRFGPGGAKALLEATISAPDVFSESVLTKMAATAAAAGEEAAAARAALAATLSPSKSKKPAWGGGKTGMNTAKGKVDTGRTPPLKIPDSIVTNEFSPEEAEARRVASERSQRLLAEIRAIERQLIREESMDRARSRSPRVRAAAITSAGAAGGGSLSQTNNSMQYSSSPGYDMNNTNGLASSTSPGGTLRPTMPSAGYFPKSRQHGGTSGNGSGGGRGRLAASGSRIISPQPSTTSGGLSSGYNSLIDMNNPIGAGSSMTMMGPGYPIMGNSNNNNNANNMMMMNGGGSISNLSGGGRSSTSNGIMTPMGGLPAPPGTAESLESANSSLMMFPTGTPNGGASSPSANYNDNAAMFLDALGLNRASVTSSTMNDHNNSSTGMHQRKHSKSPSNRRGNNNRSMSPEANLANRPTFFPSEAYEPSTFGVNGRDKEFDKVAKKLASLRAAELKQRGELRLIQAYTSPPLI